MDKEVLQKIQSGSIEGLIDGMTEIMYEVTKATMLVTALAHERGNESVGIGSSVHQAAITWIKSHYQSEYGNLILDPDAFFRRLVLFVRDETEFQLGVKDRPEKRTVYK